MPTAYTQVHFRLDFVMKANIMNPDQTADHWEQSDQGPLFVSNIDYLRTYADNRVDNKS